MPGTVINILQILTNLILKTFQDRIAYILLWMRKQRHIEVK